jgi:hypothetical protein
MPILRKHDGSGCRRNRTSTGLASGDTVDALGVREATWTASAFAVPPFEAEIEGFTALPGASRTYARGPDGTLAMTTPLAPPQVAPPTVPPLGTADRMPDGFRIQMHAADLGVYPAFGVEPLPHDVMLYVVGENYREFLSWGLQKGWSGTTGHVYIDDDTAASCIACVFISQQFNIHISSAAVQALGALGYTYPDDRAALSTVIGHEMFHNFQNAYSKPTTSATFMGGAYAEGMARAQETFHEYSAVTHQDDSLVYAADANGCNDELGVQGTVVTLHDGPATSQSYSACDFWLSFYGRHGVDGYRALLEASPAHATKGGWTEIKSVVEDALDAPVDDELAGFAAAMLTDEQLAWAPASGNGAVIDWSTFLDGWVVPTLAPGGSYTQRVRDGGMAAARVNVDGVVTTNAPEATALYVVRDDGSFTRIQSGDIVDAPAWIVSILPGTGTVTPTLSYA